VTDGHRPATEGDSENDVEELGLGAGHGAGGGSSFFEADHREAFRRNASAIAAGKELLEMVSQDTQLDAETCMALIGQSPDRKLTCRVLGLGGDSRAVAMSDNGLLDLRGYRKFPECVASSSTFDVCLDHFSAFGEETSRARMTRLHTAGTANGPLDALFLPRYDIEVIHGGCRNNLLLRLGAAAELPVKAQVTVNVDPTTDRISSANVLRLLEPEAIVDGLRNLLIQLDLPFEEASGTDLS
jgi:hypothetical protein